MLWADKFTNIYYGQLKILSKSLSTMDPVTELLMQRQTGVTDRAILRIPVFQRVEMKRVLKTNQYMVIIVRKHIIRNAE